MANIHIELLRSSSKMPELMTPGGCIYKVFVSLPVGLSQAILPNGRLMCQLGFKIELPANWVCFLRSNEALMWQNVYAHHSTYDSSYKSELTMPVYNFGANTWTCAQNEWIGQMILVQAGISNLVQGVVT